MEDHTTRRISQLVGERLIEALSEPRPDKPHDLEGVRLAMLGFKLIDIIERQPETYADPAGDIERILNAIGERLGAK